MAENLRMFSMESNLHKDSKEVLANISRSINCLNDDNRAVRKKSLLEIQAATSACSDLRVFQQVFLSSLKSILSSFRDPVEKCREISVGYVKESLSRVDYHDEALQYIIPVLVQRLGQQEIVEPSEEIRLLQMMMLSDILSNAKIKVAPYLDEYVIIFQRAVIDPYPEVRKSACRCCSSLAEATSTDFHKQSETLVNPLLLGLSHQHSRVRVEVVKAIGNVVLYGNNKSVTDVTSHLAQRLFDQASIVRSAVFEVAGNWLLDLPDRYSFHHKILPLLLTGLTDEVIEVSRKTAALWHDVGFKYGQENVEEIKDKLDFLSEQLEHYPNNEERPNLGCRQLVYRNFFKILPGLLNDLKEWQAETRLMAARLLNSLLLCSEKNSVQHSEKLFTALSQAFTDEDSRVVMWTEKSCQLLSYFVEPKHWVNSMLDKVQITQNFGPVATLANLCLNAEPKLLCAHCNAITTTLEKEDFLFQLDLESQKFVLFTCEHLLNNCPDDIDCQQIFDIIVGVGSLAKSTLVSEKSVKLTEKLAQSNALSVKDLYSTRSGHLLTLITKDAAQWSQFSPQLSVFEQLLLVYPLNLTYNLDELMPTFLVTLNPKTEVHLRARVLMLLAKAWSALQTSASESDGTIDEVEGPMVAKAPQVVEEILLKNMIWSAGRSAAALRTVAASCLWTFLRNPCIVASLVEANLFEQVLTQVLGLLEDDIMESRDVAVHLFGLILDKLPQGKLYNLYPHLQKRLDDSNNNIRLETAKVYKNFMQLLHPFNVDLYAGHLQEIISGLLIHLDDPDPDIQEAVFDILEETGPLQPDLFMSEIEKVQFKHRDTKYLDRLKKSLSEKMSNS